MEHFRPLLPVGYEAGAAAYREALEGLSAASLTSHYTHGLDSFHHEFVPLLKDRLKDLTGGAWDLDDFVGYAAGSDVDLMSHLVEAVAPREGAVIYPGDWYGFLVGGTQDKGISWEDRAPGKLACLCLPAVRNGQVTEDMALFLESADACLLNINLFPTFPAQERKLVAERLQSVLHKSVISVSFSRGFGLTASQLGVALVHKDHPYRERFKRQWGWFTYFHNAIATKAFEAIDVEALRSVDDRRRAWVFQWLSKHNLPVVKTGTYYVKSFRVEGPLPEELKPLSRGDVVRLCFKPPIY